MFISKKELKRLFNEIDEIKRDTKYLAILSKYEAFSKIFKKGDKVRFHPKRSFEMILEGVVEDIYHTSNDIFLMIKVGNEIHHSNVNLAYEVK